MINIGPIGEIKKKRGTVERIDSSGPFPLLFAGPASGLVRTTPRAYSFFPTRGPPKAWPAVYPSFLFFFIYSFLHVGQCRLMTACPCHVMLPSFPPSFLLLLQFPTQKTRKTGQALLLPFEPGPFLSLSLSLPSCFLITMIIKATVTMHWTVFNLG